MKSIKGPLLILITTFSCNVFAEDVGWMEINDSLSRGEPYIIENYNDGMIDYFKFGFDDKPLIITMKNNKYNFILPPEIGSFSDEQLSSAKEQLSESLLYSEARASGKEDHAEVFYITRNRSFSCPALNNWNSCKNGRVELVYKITKFASKAYDSRSPGNRDKHIIIELENEESGAGIGLNDNLIAMDWYNNDGSGDWGHSAYASSYDFDVSLRDSPNTYLSGTVPSNQNGEYFQTISTSNSYSFGGLSFLKDPFSYFSRGTSKDSSQRYEVKDFNIRRNDSGLNSSVSFSRQKYSNHCELLKARQFGYKCWFTDTLFRGHQTPYELSKLNDSPIGWLNFKPNTRTHYVNQQSAWDGDSHIDISSSVQWTSLIGKSSYTSLNFVYGGQTPISGTFKDKFTFTFSWNDPIFLGQELVNIRSVSSDNMCLSSKGLSFVKCNPMSADQSFMYTIQENYRLVNEPEKCLSRANEMVVIERCDESNRMKWEWVSTSTSGDLSYLVNKFTKEYLSYSDVSMKPTLTKSPGKKLTTENTAPWMGGA